jgi:predicted enzyme related to lactoylglutathione lyase
MSVEHFAFTKLVVADLDRCALFYEAVCGLKPQSRIEGHVGERPITEIVYEPTQEGGGAFVLLAYGDGPPAAAGEIIVGFASPDADAFVARALAAGAAVVQAVRDAPAHSLRVGFVNDPEGHLIEVIQRY